MSNRLCRVPHPAEYLKLGAEQDRKGGELLESEANENIPLARRLGGDWKLVFKYRTVVNTDCVTELLMKH